MRTIRIDITTSSSGAATVSGGAGVGAFRVHAIDYVPTDLASSGTVTVTDEFAGASFTIWTKASIGGSDVRVFPRALEQLNSDGSDLSTHTEHVVMGYPKVTIAAGGNAKTGSVYLHCFEE